MNRAVSAVAALVFLLFALPALAAKDAATARARQEFSAAERNFSLGEFAKALTHYREAYRLKPYPAMLFNMGQCHRLLGEYRQATFSYRQFLLKKKDVSPGDRSDVERLIAECERKSAGTPTTEKPLASHEAEKPTKKAEATSFPKGKPHKNRSEAPISNKTVSAAESQRTGTWFWVAVSSSAALLVAGSVTAVVAKNRNDSFRAQTTLPNDRTGLRDTGRTLEAASWASFGLAGAAALGAGALYLLSGSRDQRTTSPVTAAFDAKGGTLFIQGRF